MSTPLICIKQAEIGYNNQPALTEINFDINRGEHWAIVGNSGSGKTTLLNAIAGNLQLRKGEIIRNFAKKDDYHKHLAFVSSRHHFRNLSNTSDFYYQQRFNSMDAEDAATINDYLLSIARPDNEHRWDFDKTINLLQLPDLLDKQLIKLSNGETKRLTIAAALLKNPDIILLDNPLAGLDVTTRNDFNNIINSIATSGITIIMATPADEIPDMITHIGLLKEGALHQFDKQAFINETADKLHTNTPININIPDYLLNKYPVQQYQYIVDMQKVHIQYGNKIILNNINWRITQGERWALSGHNGAGKSTLLSLINGDNPQAYANNIVLFDKKRGSGESIWDIKKKIGFISPEFYQYFPMGSTCLQAVESGYYDTVGLFRPSERLKAQLALEWLKILHIDKYAHKPLNFIPASAQRLCLLARAMIKNPVLLILDEPCQGLDDSQIDYFKNLIDTICKQTNISLIYVTHYKAHIPPSVTKTLELKDGEIVS